MADDQAVRSFGGVRRGAPPPADEFPDRVVLPAMVLKPVELPVVLTIDSKELEATVQMVRDTFYAAARAGMAQAVQELAGDEESEDAGPDPAADPTA